MNTVGRRMWLWRTERGLTIAEAAQMAGISFSLWRTIEAGTAQCTDKTAKKLAPVLGVKQWWRLCG